MNAKSSHDLIESRAREALGHLDESDREEVHAWIQDRVKSATDKIRRRDWFGGKLVEFGFAGGIIGGLIAVAIAANGCTDIARKEAEHALRQCEAAVDVLSKTCGGVE